MVPHLRKPEKGPDAAVLEALTPSGAPGAAPPPADEIAAYGPLSGPGEPDADLEALAALEVRLEAPEDDPARALDPEVLACLAPAGAPEGKPVDAYLEACGDVDMGETPDDDLDLLVLFADVLDDPAAIEAREREWRALL